MLEAVQQGVRLNSWENIRKNMAKEHPMDVENSKVPVKATDAKYEKVAFRHVNIPRDSKLEERLKNLL